MFPSLYLKIYIFFLLESLFSMALQFVEYDFFFFLFRAQISGFISYKHKNKRYYNKDRIILIINLKVFINVKMLKNINVFLNKIHFMKN